MINLCRIMQSLLITPNQIYKCQQQKQSDKHYNFGSVMQSLWVLVLFRLLPDTLASLCGHHFHSDTSEISFNKSEYIAFHHSVVSICKNFILIWLLRGRLAGTREITTLCNNDNGNVMYGS